MAKRKISIPLVVTRTGAMAAGVAYADADDGQRVFEGDDMRAAFSALWPSDRDSGFQIVHVEAEIDVEKLFQEHVVKGEVRDEAQ